MWLVVPGRDRGPLPDAPLDGEAVAGLAGGLQFPTNDEINCLALTLYWEAKTEGRDGMLAVGWVVLNRMAHSEFPDLVCEVVRQGGEVPGCQFSYWCDGKSDTPRDEALWTLARELASQLVSDPPPDPTSGALFFHADYLNGVDWSPAHERTVQIGRHVYYR